jgi:hypothetical protein
MTDAKKAALQDVQDVLQKMVQVHDTYKAKIDGLKQRGEELIAINETAPTWETLQDEIDVWDQIEATLDECETVWNELTAKLDNASTAWLETGITNPPGYYKAAHSKDIQDVYSLAFSPRRAVMTALAKGEIPVSTLDLGSGLFLKTYWNGGIPKQDGKMLPQYIRKLWTPNPRQDFVEFNIHDYMELRNDPNVTRTEANVETELFRLAHTVFSFENEDGPQRAFALVETHKLDNSGNFRITLSKGLHEMLIACGKHYHQYPDPMFQINMHHNPNAWEIGNYIADKKSQVWHQFDGDSMDFSTLEIWAAASDLPSEETVRAGGSHFVKEIVRKIEKELDLLQELKIYKWTYKGRGAGGWGKSFNDWKKAWFAITFIGNPYDSYDKPGRRKLDLQRREIRLLEAEKQKAIKNGKKGKRGKK